MLTDNDLTGTVPASWLQLPSLRDVVVSPGNPELCTAVPLGAQFTLCSSADMLCLTPLPVDDDACPGGSSSGGGVPAAAVAVPVAVAGAAVLAAAAFLLWRRRRRQAAAGGAAEDKAEAAEAAESGPLPPGSVKFWPGQASAALRRAGVAGLVALLHARAARGLCPSPPALPAMLLPLCQPPSAPRPAGQPAARGHRPNRHPLVWQHEHCGGVG